MWRPLPLLSRLSAVLPRAATPPLPPWSSLAVRLAGHNKWSKIKRAKAANDEQRNQRTVKTLREIITCARLGGHDPALNARLASLLDHARQLQVPRANVENALAKAQGKGADAAALTQVLYEGYGPKGIAILIEAITDNKNRTVGQIRAVMNKKGGTLGAQGSVEWMFERKGLLLLQGKDQQTPQSVAAMMERALEADIEDANEVGEDQVEVVCDPGKLGAVKSLLEAHGTRVAETQVTLVPKTEAPALDGEPEVQEAVDELVAALDALDDVVRVHTNLP